MVSEFLGKQLGRGKGKSWRLGSEGVSRWESGYCKEWELGEDLGEPAHYNGIDFFLIYYDGFFKVEENYVCLKRP